MGSVSSCGITYRSRLSHRTVPHPTLDPAPGAGAVEELLVAAQLVGCARPGGTPGRGALFEGRDVAAQRRGGGDAEGSWHCHERPVSRRGRSRALPAHSSDCRPGSGFPPWAISTLGHFHPGPVTTDFSHQPAQGPRHCLGRRRPARASAPVGRRAGRSMAATGRPSPSNTTMGWKPYSS